MYEHLLFSQYFHFVIFVRKSSRNICSIHLLNQIIDQPTFFSRVPDVNCNPLDLLVITYPESCSTPLPSLQYARTTHWFRSSLLSMCNHPNQKFPSYLALLLSRLRWATGILFLRSLKYTMVLFHKPLSYLAEFHPEK